jgi:hypothetical protein
MSSIPDPGSEMQVSPKRKVCRMPIASPGCDCSASSRSLVCNIQTGSGYWILLRLLAQLLTNDHPTRVRHIAGQAWPYWPFLPQRRLPNLGEMTVDAVAPVWRRLRRNRARTKPLLYIYKGCPRCNQRTSLQRILLVYYTVEINWAYYL